MARTKICRHEGARFHCVQRLGNLPPIELWHCPTCKSTVSIEGAHGAPAAYRRDAV